MTKRSEAKRRAEEEAIRNGIQAVLEPGERLIAYLEAEGGRGSPFLHDFQSAIPELLHLLDFGILPVLGLKRLVAPPRHVAITDRSVVILKPMGKKKDLKVLQRLPQDTELPEPHAIGARRRTQKIKLGDQQLYVDPIWSIKVRALKGRVLLDALGAQPAPDNSGIKEP